MLTTRVATNIRMVKILGKAPETETASEDVVAVEVGVVAGVDVPGADVSLGISIVKVTLAYPMLPAESFPYA